MVLKNKRINKVWEKIKEYFNVLVEVFQFLKILIIKSSFLYFLPRLYINYCCLFHLFYVIKIIKKKSYKRSIKCRIIGLNDTH